MAPGMPMQPQQRPPFTTYAPRVAHPMGNMGGPAINMPVR